MAIVIAAGLLAAGIIAAAVFLRAHPAAATATRGGGSTATAPVVPSAPLTREDVDDELRERRAEIVRIEERVLSKEEAIDAKLSDLGRREQAFADRERNLEREREKLQTAKNQHLRELERIANLSASQAKQILLKEIEDELRHDSARLVRQIEEETKRDADRRVRNILSVCMQRLAASHAAETTVSVVELHRGRHEGPDHRPRGPQHPGAGEPHRRRLHHRRHPERGRALELRRRAARDRAPHAREAALRRAHPPGPDRGDVLPGQVGDRQPHHRVRRAGRLRGQHRRARSRAGQAPRPHEVPDELRPERARALDRVRPPGRA